MSGNGRLAGKVAIVTGGASGFGAAITTLFAQEGCNVLLCDLNEELAHTVAKPYAESKQVQVCHMDVTKEEAWTRAVKACLDNWGGIDILVNNAGTSYRNKPTLDVTEAEFDLVFKVNVKSIFWSVKTVVPQFKKQGRGGSIINISSIGAARPRPGLVYYNATKGAVSNATNGLASEFGADQIRVNDIRPLLSGTGLFESFVGVPDTPENREKFTGQVPMGRLTDPLDIAKGALFFASDDSKFVTGDSLVIDGGKSI
ncbi:oxidoreductase [Eremomyces bilateralis CBS 781.70]|uniref:Oxidoreductase n=1 Tax=Eremomyces bilateralis CBS 781.70 TaxID=1392243 RepID=A0A6G1FUE2_9PEZI|nr:oxidoreductase [Eremomyces bilateralis CBS 781.70]KAF1809515.1 oxidoreductase [Eremomyces bilateralis CBS 781.70]